MKNEERAVKTEEALVAIANQSNTVKLNLDSLTQGMATMIQEQVVIAVKERVTVTVQEQKSTIVPEKVPTVMQEQVTAIMQDQMSKLLTVTSPSISYADTTPTPPGSQPGGLRTLSM